MTVYSGRKEKEWHAWVMDEDVEAEAALGKATRKIGKQMTRVIVAEGEGPPSQWFRKQHKPIKKERMRISER